MKLCSVVVVDVSEETRVDGTVEFVASVVTAVLIWPASEPQS